MTLREEILTASGVLNESAEDALSDLKNFRKALKAHSFAYGFEEKAVDALENNNKDIIPLFISDAKICRRDLGFIAELISKEQELISEKINEVEKLL